MAFSFDLGLAISAERYGAISAGPEQRISPTELVGEILAFMDMVHGGRDLGKLADTPPWRFTQNMGWSQVALSCATACSTSNFVVSDFGVTPMVSNPPCFSFS